MTPPSPIPPNPNNELTPDQCLGLIREEIARLRKPPLAAAGTPQPWHQLCADLGLSSQEVVDLVAALEVRLALGPSECLPHTDLRTVADVCQACLNSRNGGEDPAKAALAASWRRGAARRRP